jgi:hypothetical protein
VAQISSAPKHAPGSEPMTSAPAAIAMHGSARGTNGGMPSEAGGAYRPAVRGLETPGGRSLLDARRSSRTCPSARRTGITGSGWGGSRRSASPDRAARAGGAQAPTSRSGICSFCRGNSSRYSPVKQASQ